MNQKFNVGDLVRWNIPDGQLCKVIRQWNHEIYEIQTIPDCRLLIGYLDDFILVERAHE